MKYDFLVLGADGMQGTIATRDLLNSGFSVYASDIFKSRIGKLLKEHRRLAFAHLDVSDTEAVSNLILKSGADVVVNCAEGNWNTQVYHACLQTHTHCIDLGSRLDMTKAQLKMSPRFAKIKRIAVSGCGSVPGIGNLMAAFLAKRFDSLDSLELGFAWDSHPKKFVVPFSIESILEEYSLPAPYISNHRLRKKNPLDSVISRHYRGIGTQKSILADHSETWTLYQQYKRKGLRNVKFYAGFPDHSDHTIRTLVDLGFADREPLKLRGVEVLPHEFLTQFLKRLKLPKGYKEWENLWVDLTGKVKRKKKKSTMECLVSTLPGWEFAGSNVDTGMPASIIAQMIQGGHIRKYGSFAPEGVIPPIPFFKELQKRKMRFYIDGARHVF